MKNAKEAMWRKYYQVRISSSFQSLWKHFIDKSIAAVAQPLMYQYLTDRVFEAIIESVFTVKNQDTTAVESLTYEEANALRYVAGYVCFKLRQNITASTHPLRDKMLLCLMDLCDEDEETSPSADWVHAVNRGGLVRVSKNTFSLFHRMEMIVRSVFNKEKMYDMTKGIKLNLSKEDEDIALYWCMLTIEIEYSDGAVLLGMMVDLYITIRGFSFTKSVMEMYKQKNKRCTQKAKSLRRKLPTT